MARDPNDVFILGEEAFDAGLGAEPRGEEDDPSSVLADAPELPAPAPSGSWLPRRLALAALAVGCCAALLAALALSGKGDKGVESDPESALGPAPQVQLPPGASAAPTPSHHPPLLPPTPASRPRADQPSRRPTGRAEREPIAEPAPVSPPIDEPAPASEARSVPATPPPDLSPPRPFRGGSGGRPEFGIEH